MAAGHGCEACAACHRRVNHGAQTSCTSVHFVTMMADRTAHEEKCHRRKRTRCVLKTDGTRELHMIGGGDDDDGDGDGDAHADADANDDDDDDDDDDDV